MPTLAELVAQLAQQADRATRQPEAVPPSDASPWETWLRLDRDWPPFEPVAWPKAGADLEWLWQTLWPGLGMPGVLDEARAAADAAREAEMYPQSADVLRRAADPHWLDRLVAVSEETAEGWTFTAISHLLATSLDAAEGPVERARLAWVQQHRHRISPLVEEARRRFLSRYG